MIKTILVPTSGSDTDESVFATALHAGQALGAHLQLYHVDLSLGEASLHAHLEFCQGPGLANALESVRQNQQELSLAARQHFDEFCSAHRVPIYQTPGAVEGISASWLRETDESSGRLLFHARHHDLVVLGRRRNQDYLAGGLIQGLLIGSGRPILIAPPKPPRSITGTVVVAWKETAESARSLALALPLLKRARKTVLLAVTERGSASREALHECAKQLAWHGINPDIVVVGDGSQPTATELVSAAARERAEMLVVGGFGHARFRELIFGGVTQALMEHADLPVFMAH